MPVFPAPRCFSTSELGLSVWVRTAQVGGRQKLPVQPATSLGSASHSLTARDQQRPLLWGGRRWPPWLWGVAQEASQTRALLHTDLPRKPQWLQLLAWARIHTSARISHVNALTQNVHLSASSQGAAIRTLTEPSRTGSCDWPHLVFASNSDDCSPSLGGLPLRQPDLTVRWVAPREVPCGSEDKSHTLKWATNPQEGSGLLLVSIYFSACLLCGFLFASAYCTVVTCWPLFDFCTEKKLCYRNQHTIFLNLERRYYGDWKYGQVSNINVQTPCCIPSGVQHPLYICWQYWRILFVCVNSNFYQGIMGF